MASHEVVYSWAVEYAKSGRSTCQASKEKIDEGAVRIGKEVDNPHKPGAKMFLWYKPAALFDQFRKGAESKPRIKAVGEIDGFDGLRAADAAELRALVEAELAFRAGLQAVESDAEMFEHPEGKFWSIVAAGNTTRVKWGKIGEEGQLSEKSHADEDAAQKFVDKMVKEKTKGGYVRKASPAAGGGSGAAVADAAPAAAEGKKGAAAAAEPAAAAPAKSSKAKTKA